MRLKARHAKVAGGSGGPENIFNGDTAGEDYGFDVLSSPEMSASDFNAISGIVRENAGISLHSGKQALVKARLGKRLRQLGLNSFREYLNYLRRDDGKEFILMLDAISTNVTHFFREAEHFHFLEKRALAPLHAKDRNTDRKIRLWSAGCSSGEEPYTMAIVLSESIPNLRFWDAKILATDLSTKVLAKARQGIYIPDKLKEVPPPLLDRYFISVGKEYQVRPELRRMVHFARLNLMGEWPMRGPFDVIFCRNVMIYFDRDVRQVLIRRFYEMLAYGGYLFIGHSESFSGIANDFTFVEPTIYRKMKRTSAH